jgi:hypothetical protein
VKDTSTKYYKLASVISIQSAMAALACDKSFSSGHFLLKPEEVRFFDLIRFLFSSDIENGNFLDSTEGKEESFRRRWLIFVSILAQKFLLFVAKPLAAIGSMIEMWLNLLSSNRNLGVLLLNLIRGQSISSS